MEFDWYWFVVTVLIICVTVYNCLNSYWKHKYREQLEDNKTVTLRAALTPWSTGEKVRVTDTRVSPWRTMIIVLCKVAPS